MKKIIIILALALSISTISTKRIYSIGMQETYLDDGIFVCAGCDVDKDITVSLNPEAPEMYFNVDITSEFVINPNEISTWFLNIPSWLTITLVEFNDVDTPDEMTVNFAGTAPDEEVASIPLIINIPANKTIFNDLPNPNIVTNEDSDDPDEIAILVQKPIVDYVDNYEIVGKVNEAITPVSVFVQITNIGSAQEDFDPSVVDYEFETINGITPKVKSYDNTTATIEIEFTGTPLQASTDDISLIIPKEKTLNKWCQLAIATGKAKFNIEGNIPEPEPEPQPQPQPQPEPEPIYEEPYVYIAPTTGVN